MRSARVKELRAEAMQGALELLAPAAREVGRELLTLAMKKKIDPDVKRRALVDILNLFNDYGHENLPIGRGAPTVQIINHMEIPGIAGEPRIVPQAYIPPPEPELIPLAYDDGTPFVPSGVAVSRPKRIEAGETAPVKARFLSEGKSALEPETVPTPKPPIELVPKMPLK